MTTPARTLLTLAAIATAALGTQCSSSSSSDVPDAGGTDSPTNDAPAPPTDAATSHDVSTDAPDAAPDAPGDAGVERPGIFVAVGDGGRRIRSTDDGVTWTDDVAITPDGGGDDFVGLRTVAWGNGLFVAGAWRIMTSPDGKTWTDYPPNVFNQNWMGAFAYGAGLHVGVGGYGSRVASADGITWTQHSIDNGATHAHDALTYGSGKGFVSANDMGQRSYSSDGLTWTYATGAATVSTTRVAYGAGVFVGIGGVAVVTSADGMTWSSGSTLTVAPSTLLFAQGHFTAIAAAHVFTSNDGQAWADHPVTGLASTAVAYGHGTYVLLDGNKVRRSTDGLTWDAPSDLGGKNGLSWLAFGEAK